MWIKKVLAAHPRLVNSVSVCGIPEMSPSAIKFQLSAIRKAHPSEQIDKATIRFAESPVKSDFVFLIAGLQIAAADTLSVMSDDDIPMLDYSSDDNTISHTYCILCGTKYGSIECIFRGSCCGFVDSGEVLVRDIHISV